MKEKVKRKGGELPGIWSFSSFFINVACFVNVTLWGVQYGKGSC
jgi:hypothetical protein